MYFTAIRNNANLHNIDYCLPYAIDLTVNSELVYRYVGMYVPFLKDADQIIYHVYINFRLPYISLVSLWAVMSHLSFHMTCCSCPAVVQSRSDPAPRAPCRHTRPLARPLVVSARWPPTSRACAAHSWTRECASRTLWAVRVAASRRRPHIPDSCSWEAGW